MSTAISGAEKNYKQAESVAGRRFRIKKYVHRDSAAVRAKTFFARSCAYAVLAGLLLTVFAAAGFLYFYNHYSQIVERRIASGFWHTRAGLYAAPRVLRLDQKISKKDVVELLRRSGYIEGGAAEMIWNGSFTDDGDAVSIKENDYYGTKIRTVRVEFKGGRITSIRDEKGALESFEIQPELLSGRSEAKRGASRALKYEQIPEVLRNAILTAEDQRFFHHPGIDVKSIARAFYVNLTDSEIRQGASTITQQLIKNTFLTPEKTFTRKFSEAFLAVALEKKMSKEDIFALYCNEIYLGQYGSAGIHGVEQAARVYFGKDLKDLNLTEAAAIAAMIKNPTVYAPHKAGEQAKARREWIIAKMRESGFVSAEEAEKALKTGLAVVPPKRADATIAPYFVDAATKRLTEEFSEEIYNTNFNRRVYTTVDTQLQEIAEQAVAGQIARLDKIYGKKGKRIEAALVALDPHTGHVLALVGGRDYNSSQFNRAVEALRQPGSVFKPFVYAAALERGMTPISTFADTRTEFNFDNGKPYVPANYGGSYSNAVVTMKTALAKSSNVVAVKAAMETGLEAVAAKAEEFGFQNIQPVPSMALGSIEVTPLQLAAAYAVFANGGRQVTPTFVSKIVSGEDKVIYESAPDERQIISPETAFMMTDMLEAVVERGTARSARGALGRSVVFAGKTGSSKDGWFVGYTPNLVTVVWIGLDETEDIEMTGGETALPLWTEFMRRAVTVRPELGGRSFPVPKGMTSIEVDPETGMLADANCPRRERVVMPSSAAPNIHCLKHQAPAFDTLVAAAEEQIEPLIETIIITPESAAVEIEAATKAESGTAAGKDLPGKANDPEKIKAPGRALKKTKTPDDATTFIEEYETQIKEKS